MLSSCSSSSTSSSYNRSGVGSDYGATASLKGQLVPPTAQKSAATLYREANVKQDLIPEAGMPESITAACSRAISPFTARRIFPVVPMPCDILRLLKTASFVLASCVDVTALATLSGTYTVDEDRAVQHLPTNEQGEHADFSGPGNRYSIGIEMCENRGNSRIRHDRTHRQADGLPDAKA